MAYNRRNFLTGLAAGRMLRGAAFRDPSFVLDNPVPRPTDDPGPILRFYTWAGQSTTETLFHSAANYALLLETQPFNQYRFRLENTAGICWAPTWSDLNFNGGIQFGNSEGLAGNSLGWEPPLSASGGKTWTDVVDTRFTVSLNAGPADAGGRKIRFRFSLAKSKDYGWSQTYLRPYVNVRAPVYGNYTKLASGTVYASGRAWHIWADANGHPINGDPLPYYWSRPSPAMVLGVYESGATVYVPLVQQPYNLIERAGSPPMREIEGYFHMPMFTISPDGDVAWQPRAGQIAGHFGILDGGGNLLPLSSVTRQIVSEENELVYDPDREEFVGIHNYAYYYDTRTYFINLSDPEDPASADILVTFGDDAVTFRRNGADRSIYYITPMLLDENFLKGLLVGQRLREWAMGRGAV